MMRAWAAIAASRGARRRRREIDDAFGIGDERRGIAGYLDAAGRQARERAHVLAEAGRIGAIDRAGERKARRLQNGTGERTAHPAAGTRDD